MILQYNFQTCKKGHEKVNHIDSKNQTSSKVTIINGTRFKIRYPYNIKNNLTSNVMVIESLKFGEAEKVKTPKLNRINGVPNCNSVHLKIKKVRILCQSMDKNIKKSFSNDKGGNNNYHIENSNFHTNKLKERTANETSQNPNNNFNCNDNIIRFINEKRNKLQAQMPDSKMTWRKSLNRNNDNLTNNESVNFQSIDSDYTNKNNNNIYYTNNSNNKFVSPIINLPTNISKSKVLPSIRNNNSSRIAVLKFKENIRTTNNNNHKNISDNLSYNNYNYQNTANNEICGNEDLSNFYSEAHNLNTDLNLNYTNERLNFGLNSKSSVNVSNSKNNIHRKSKYIDLSPQGGSGRNFLKRIRQNNQYGDTNSNKKGENSPRNKKQYYLNKDLKDFENVIIDNNYNLLKHETLEKEFKNVIHTSENIIFTERNSKVASPDSYAKNSSNELFKIEKNYTLQNNPNNKFFLVKLFLFDYFSNFFKKILFN